jgi:hypothetical protein
MVLIHNYHKPDAAIRELKKCVKFYWRNRANPIARSRIKSAINIIKELKNEV